MSRIRLRPLRRAPTSLAPASAIFVAAFACSSPSASRLTALPGNDADGAVGWGKDDAGHGITHGERPKSDQPAMDAANTTSAQTDESEGQPTPGAVPPAASAAAFDGGDGGSTAAGSDGGLDPAHSCSFDRLRATRRDVQLAGADGACLTLEANKLKVADCSGPTAVQLIVDPVSCNYQIASKEDHVYSDPGGSRYLQGTTCLAFAEDTLTTQTCDSTSAAQRFELSERAGGVQFAAVGTNEVCIRIDTAGASHGACSEQASTLNLTEKEGPLVDAIMDTAPINVGTSNFWDTAGTELPLTQLQAVQGYAYSSEGKYLEQVDDEAYLELAIESSVTGRFLVHANYATPFDAVKWEIHQDGEFREEFELLSTDAWRVVRAGPSFRLDLVAGQRSTVRIQALSGLPHRLHRLFLTPPLPDTQRLKETTLVPTEGATIPADAVHDVYRIGAAIEDGVWWWRAAWTHARVEYAVEMQTAGEYELRVAYRAQSLDEPGFWGKRIVVDDNYETFNTVEVQGPSEGQLKATLTLGAGLHRILLEHPGHDIGEPMLGNVWTSDLQLVPLP